VCVCCLRVVFVCVWSCYLSLCVRGDLDLCGVCGVRFVYDMFCVFNVCVCVVCRCVVLGTCKFVWGVCMRFRCCVFGLCVGYMGFVALCVCVTCMFV